MNSAMERASSEQEIEDETLILPILEIRSSKVRRKNTLTHKKNQFWWYGSHSTVELDSALSSATLLVQVDTLSAFNKCPPRCALTVVDNVSNDNW